MTWVGTSVSSKVQNNRTKSVPVRLMSHKMFRILWKTGQKMTEKCLRYGHKMTEKWSKYGHKIIRISIKNMVKTDQNPYSS